MGYSLIVLVASVALVVYFIWVTEASFVTKVVVGGLFGFGFACFFWIRGWALVGVYLLLAVSIFIVLYRAWEQAQYSGK